jgi:uncharacterized protein YndB with AHSA1/START domain
MTNIATETRSVVVERELPFLPEKIWRALPQPHLIEAWLMKNDFKPVVDHNFTLRGDWGSVDCQVLTVEPNKTLAYAWGAMGLESVVTWTLTPTVAGRGCAWSSRASPRIRSRPTEAPRPGGGGSLQTWSRSWGGLMDRNMNKSDASPGQSASELISNRIAQLGDWRGETLGRMRRLIKEEDPDVVEEWKWMGTPVWSHDGIICTGESYKKVVKLTFAKGAALEDPTRLFNSSLEGNVRRAIDIPEGEAVDEAAFKALVRQAIALNSAGKSKPPKKAKS